MSEVCGAPGCASGRTTYYSTLGGVQRASNVPVGGYNMAAGDVREVIFYGYLCDAHARANGLWPCAFSRALDPEQATA